MVVMEIYANDTNRTASLKVPVSPIGDTMTVNIKKDGVIVYTVNTVTFVDGAYNITVPFFLTQEDNTLTIEWVFQYIEDGNTYDYKKETHIDVITPILPISSIRDVVDDEEWDDDEYSELERNVRYIIQSHTGQKFGLEVGKKIIYGNGQKALSLPQRLISMDTINGYAFPNLLTIMGDGWYLQQKPWSVPDVRADIYGINIAEVPINYPYGVNAREFVENQRFEITGTWGWNEVPAPVVEAAKLLVNDYSGDTLYRDRYLVSMTAADWRIQFTNGAFAKTGNVRADQLLAPYVLKRGWAIL